MPVPAVAMPSDTVLYAIGAGLFLLVLLLVVVLVMRSRRQREATPPPGQVSWGDEAAPEPVGAPSPAAFPEPTPDPLAAAEPPGQVHYCRCPACQTQFTVTGTKPIVTNCPGCGKKGYLR